MKITNTQLYKIDNTYIAAWNITEAIKMYCHNYKVDNRKIQSVELIKSFCLIKEQ